MEELVQTLNNVGTFLTTLYAIIAISQLKKTPPPTGHRILGLFKSTTVCAFLLGFMACVIFAKLLVMKATS